MGKTTIAWTEYTWSPIRAKVKQEAAAIAKQLGYTSLIKIATKMVGHIGPHCERISPGCGAPDKGDCYSAANNLRCLPSNGTGLPFDRRSRDLVDVFLDTNILAQPMHWREPRVVFVENQSDLFGEFVSFDMIDCVFAVMAMCPHITFQVLSKRPERMLEYFSDPDRRSQVEDAGGSIPGISACYANTQAGWPLPNVWMGVSVENADYLYRLDILRQVPAALRFASLEPLLGPLPGHALALHLMDRCPECGRYYQKGSAPTDHVDCAGVPGGALNWVIVGGQSGRGSHPMQESWVRDIKIFCDAYKTPFFLKQMGSFWARKRNSDPDQWTTVDRKGAEPADWPEDLRVQEMP